MTATNLLFNYPHCPPVGGAAGEGVNDDGMGISS